jgi:hypothetical protein
LTLNNEQQPASPFGNSSQETPLSTLNTQQQTTVPLPILYNKHKSVLLEDDISQQRSSAADKKQVKRKIHTVKSSYNIRESSKRTRR